MPSTPSESESESETNDQYTSSVLQTPRITHHFHVVKCPLPSLQININQYIEAEGSFDDDNPQDTIPPFHDEVNSRTRTESESDIDDASSFVSERNANNNENFTYDDDDPSMNKEDGKYI